MWVIGPHAKAKEGMRIIPDASNRINDMYASSDG
jgi:hypothetical protein